MTPEEIAFNDCVELVCRAWKKTLGASLDRGTATIWVSSYGYPAVASACKILVHSKKEIEYPVAYVSAILRNNTHFNFDILDFS